ncbi:hypothetical protein A1355_16545 [Methylomonas koyamae]|uniref:Uncharacterized protein n=1 Tax=Methylomonas koyamae TaxID=702114 RepID=A0A177PFW6_9GAMM|nr:hypothetical protein A1355_16545 [Methylomonas koyamae]
MSAPTELLYVQQVPGNICRQSSIRHGDSWNQFAGSHGKPEKNGPSRLASGVLVAKLLIGMAVA